MSAETFAGGLAFAVALVFVVVVLALVPRFRRSLKEEPPAWSPWRLLAFVLCFILAFQLLDLVRR
jgi:CDP-diglyceride synthetase